MVRQTAPRFDWTERQFVAGALCLELANTVIYATDPARRHDRIRDMDDLGRWARRSGGFECRPAPGVLARTRAVRDAIDRVFRAVAEKAPVRAADFRRLIGHYHDVIGHDAMGTGVGSVVAGANGIDISAHAAPARPASVLPHVLQSAVGLALSPAIHRVKACPSCAWLFVDQSKGGRRIWCDMRSCGNRAKARRRYRRVKSRRGDTTGRAGGGPPRTGNSR